jgi:2'-5' RNA ligase
MRFLGELGEDGAARVALAATEAAAATAVFEAVLGGFGAYPNARRARVVWAGLKQGAEALTALSSALDRALRSRGFDRPERPFSPHLTLGRVSDAGDWTGRLSAEEAPAALRFAVHHLRVVESTLSPHGSIYRTRAEAPLAS